MFYYNYLYPTSYYWLIMAQKSHMIFTPLRPTNDQEPQKLLGIIALF